VIGTDSIETASYLLFIIYCTLLYIFTRIWKTTCKQWVNPLFPPQLSVCCVGACGFKIALDVNKGYTFFTSYYKTTSVNSRYDAVSIAVFLINKSCVHQNEFDEL
jgi:hypothetical protein